MREQLYDEIMEKAVSVAVGYASPQRIDEINILQATYEAMREAVSKLDATPQILLNDAVTIPRLPSLKCLLLGEMQRYFQRYSIVAKVTRDRLMREYDKIMPEYGFASNKGYGSKEHIEAIAWSDSDTQKEFHSCVTGKIMNEIGRKYEEKQLNFWKNKDILY